ncbi:hypothetical protein BDM02DRAFT_3115076 [Thelephora ganbajun]|uniref:Uncharacterized protein n=1 Tax=Thelephora ganbajun TaxID=370292 RepID=A0ACB6ZFU5_THEGA|nr:hypothetical protein BDM02DRAFT_3115076 [Thelephora ganbajun]
MKHYRVFLGAPSPASLYCDEGDFGWETFTTTTPILDASVFEAASRRISRLYENIIFAEDDDEDMVDASVSNFLDAEQSSRAAETFITWSQTQNRTKDACGSQVSSGLQESTIEETQESTSYEYSDTSSIGRFPHFSFNLHTLRLVKALVDMAKSSKTKGTLKVNVLVAVLEVEGPDAVTIRKGPHAGNQASILKMVLGDGDGNVLKLTAWRDVAEMWGIGTDTHPPVRRGDIVLFQDVSFGWDPSTGAPPNFTASPYMKPTAEVCYRTLPQAPQDGRLRPDLRLGESDTSVRKVAALVAWFERLAGL